LWPQRFFGERRSPHKAGQINIEPLDSFSPWSCKFELVDQSNWERPHTVPAASFRFSVGLLRDQA